MFLSLATKITPTEKSKSRNVERIRGQYDKVEEEGRIIVVGKKRDIPHM